MLGGDEGRAGRELDDEEPAVIDHRPAGLGSLLLSTVLLAASLAAPVEATSYVPMADEDLLEQASLVLAVSTIRRGSTATPRAA